MASLFLLSLGFDRVAVVSSLSIACNSACTPEVVPKCSVVDQLVEAALIKLYKVFLPRSKGQLAVAS